MSLLTPSIQVLDKGLNLQTAKLLAPPGSVLDSLNYEQVDFQGQKRIDGYTRYDGRQSAAVDELYVLNSYDDTTFTILDDNVLEVNDDTHALVGVNIDWDSIPVDVQDFLPGQFEGLVAVTNSALAAKLGAIRLRDRLEENKDQYDGSMPELHKTALIEAGKWLRTRNSQLPGGVSGLHWFRDRLYAVSDLYVVTLSAVGDLYANCILRDENGLETRVLDLATAIDGNVLVLLDGVTKGKWAARDIGMSLEIMTQDYVVTGSCTLFDPDPDFQQSLYQASLFSANSEDYSINDTSGWEFVHQGWILPFVNGKSSFGSFPAVNQNLKGVGIQGPTDITGDHGSPEAATQGNRIVGIQAQVSGWKSSNIPDSYTLVPDNIKRQDTLNIYADAFVSWSEGVITSPSHNDELVQYPATATVEVDL